MLAGADKNLLLDDQMVGGVLAEHHPGVEAGLVGQEVRQSLREGRVGQAVHAPLGEHAHHRDRHARHVHRQGHGRALEVRARSASISAPARRSGYRPRRSIRSPPASGHRPPHPAPRRSPAAWSASNRHPGPWSSSCRSARSDPSTIFMILCADVIAPLKPRSSCSLVLYGLRFPSSASMDIAAAISACLRKRSIS